MSGYQIFWPDGRPVTAGLDAFCKHGQRLLGLGRHAEGPYEREVELICFPLSAFEDEITRLPGHRVRRFFLERQGRQGRLHFLNGVPTEIVFEVGRDEPRVLRWIGLPQLREGERQWIDLASRVEEPACLGPRRGEGERRGPVFAGRQRDRVS
jgi:hypothetical protein